MFNFKYLKKFSNKFLITLFVLAFIFNIPFLACAVNSKNSTQSLNHTQNVPSKKIIDFASVKLLVDQYKYQDVISAVSSPSVNPRLNFLAGYAYLKTGRIAEAKNYLQAYLNFHPSMNYFVINLQADALFENEDLLTAENEYKRILNALKPVTKNTNFFKSPSYLELSVLNSLADIYYLKRDYKKAEKYYELLINKYHQTDLIKNETYRKLEQLYTAKHNLISKLKNWLFLSRNLNYELAAMNNSISPIQLYKKAMFLETNKNYADAYLTWQEFLQKKPSNFYLEFGLYKLAFCAFKLNRPEIAKEKLYLIIKKFPDSLLNKDVLFLLANTEEYLGNYRKALVYYNLILNKYPKTVISTNALSRMALLNYQSQNSCVPILFNMALSKQNKQLDKDIKISALSYLSLILYRLNNYKEASYFYYKLFEQSTDLDTKVKALYWLSKSKAKEHQFMAARQLIIKIKKLTLNNNQYLIYTKPLSFSQNMVNFRFDYKINLVEPIKELDILGFTTFAQNELKIKSYFAKPE
ncbi:MAG: tetratricopeptide repeat protein, partial [Candidatus Margulisiibacteriota bacterium]